MDLVLGGVSRFWRTSIPRAELVLHVRSSIDRRRKPRVMR